MARLSLTLQIFLVCMLLAVAVEGGRRRNRQRPNKECKGAKRILNPNCVKTKKNRRSVDEDSLAMTPEEFFLQLDTNKDKVIDGGEWFMSSPRISIREFVRLLDEADIDDDERLSLPELLASKFKSGNDVKQFQMFHIKPEEAVGSR